MTTKILIADDEPNIVISLEYLLQREGYTVLVARDGQEALDTIAREQPALVLLDVMMPHKTGFEVCQAVRADEALQGTKAGVEPDAGRADEHGRKLDADHAQQQVDARSAAHDGRGLEDLGVGLFGAHAVSRWPC